MSLLYTFTGRGAQEGSQLWRKAEMEDETCLIFIDVSISIYLFIDLTDKAHSGLVIIDCLIIKVQSNKSSM